MSGELGGMGATEERGGGTFFSATDEHGGTRINARERVFGSWVLGFRLTHGSRDRQGAGQDPVERDLVITLRGAFYFLLSRVYFLWQGCHRPLTPDPSPPVGARGGLGDRFSVFGFRFSVFGFWFWVTHGSRDRQGAGRTWLSGTL